MKTLLQAAARGLRGHPQYGAVSYPGDLGLHVDLVRQLEEAAEQFSGQAVTPTSPAAPAEIEAPVSRHRHTEHVSTGLGGSIEITPDVIGDHIEATAGCLPGREHLPTWIDAKRVCYYCRRSLPSSRDA